MAVIGYEEQRQGRVIRSRGRDGLRGAEAVNS